MVLGTSLLVFLPNYCYVCNIRSNSVCSYRQFRYTHVCISGASVHPRTHIKSVKAMYFHIYNYDRDHEREYLPLLPAGGHGRVILSLTSSHKNACISTLDMGNYIYCNHLHTLCRLRTFCQKSLYRAVLNF